MELWENILSTIVENFFIHNFPGIPFVEYPTISRCAIFFTCAINLFLHLVLFTCAIFYSLIIVFLFCTFSTLSPPQNRRKNTPFSTCSESLSQNYSPEKITFLCLFSVSPEKIFSGFSIIKEKNRKNRTILHPEKNFFQKSACNRFYSGLPYGCTK